MAAVRVRSAADPPETNVESAPVFEPDTTVEPATIVEPDTEVDPDASGVPETTVDPDVSVAPGGLAAFEMIVGADWASGVLGGSLRCGAAGASGVRFSSRLSSARAPGCAESSAIASTANRRAASRDPAW